MFGLNSEESKTALDTFRSQVRFIITTQYILGYELKKEWRYNNRLIYICILLSLMMWLIPYSMYLERKSLVLFVLIAGLMFELLVIFVINRQEIFRYENSFIGLRNSCDDGFLSPQILIIIGFCYEIVRKKLFRNQRANPIKNS